MRKMRVLISIILILMLIPINIYAYAQEETSPENNFSTAAQIQKVLKKYGYEGTYNPAKGDKQDFSWDMYSNVNVKKQDKTSLGSVIGTEYVATINTKTMDTVTKYENKEADMGITIRKVLKEQGLEYNGEFKLGTNRINWKGHAIVEIIEKRDETKYRYKISVYGDNFSTSSSVWEPAMMLEDAGSVNDYRWVDVYGATVYTKTGNQFTSSGQKNAGEKLWILNKYKQKNTDTYWATFIEGATTYYIKANDLKDKEPTEEEKQTAQNNINSNSGTGLNSGSTEGLFSTDFGTGGVIMGATTGSEIVDPTNSVDTYKPPELTDADMGDLIQTAGRILGFIRNIGVVVGVIGLSAMGLRYMFASLEEKAEYKATMMPFVLGCVLLMAGTTVIDFLYSVAVQFGR